MKRSAAHRFSLENPDYFSNADLATAMLRVRAAMWLDIHAILAILFAATYGIAPGVKTAGVPRAYWM